MPSWSRFAFARKRRCLQNNFKRQLFEAMRGRNPSRLFVIQFSIDLILAGFPMGENEKELSRNTSRFELL